MNSALHADFGSAGLPCLGRSVADLLQGQGVRIGIGAPLRKRAEPAAGVADIGEVNVPGDDVSDGVTSRLAAQLVGEPSERLQLRPVCGQQREGLLIGDPGRVTLSAPQRG